MASRDADAQGHRQRNMTSNIFDGAEAHAPTYKAGTRGAPAPVPAQQISTVFESESDAVSAPRNNAAPAPFLTEENAVNTKGRRGGMVNQSDSLIEAGEFTQEEIDEYNQYLLQQHQSNGNQQCEETRNGHGRAVQEDQKNLNDNTDRNNAVAASHKQRQMTSNIFDSPQAAEQNKPRQQPRQISNVF